MRTLCDLILRSARSLYITVSCSNYFASIPRDNYILCLAHGNDYINQTCLLVWISLIDEAYCRKSAAFELHRQPRPR